MVQKSTFSSYRGPVLALPELTSVKYPNLTRGNFAKIEEGDVNFFKNLLPGAGQVLDNEDDVVGYNVDWLKTVRGNDEFILISAVVNLVSW